MKCIFGILTFSMLLISFVSEGQPDRLLQVREKDHYKILKEDSVVDYFGDKLPISSDLKLTDFGKYPNFSELRFCNSRKSGDTLVLTITGGNEAIDHHYEIKVFHSRFVIKYSFQTSGGEPTEIRQDSCSLVLDSSDFRKGKIIRGHTEFRGKCLKGCYKTDIHIVGNFKTIIN